MGEIGFPRREFLHDLRWWEVRSIIRGYNRRKRDIWSSARWQTYYTMLATVGSDGMRKANLNSPLDLIKFPWERDTNRPSDDDIRELQAEMAAWNAMQDEDPNKKKSE